MMYNKSTGTDTQPVPVSLYPFVVETHFLREDIRGGRINPDRRFPVWQRYRCTQNVSISDLLHVIRMRRFPIFGEQRIFLRAGGGHCLRALYAKEDFTDWGEVLFLTDTVFVESAGFRLIPPL